MRTAHKDRDCHFRINIHWSYDGQIEYEVEHHGYIIHNRETVQAHDSLKEACFGLIEILDQAIEAELSWNEIEEEENFFTKEELKELTEKFKLIQKDYGQL